MSEISNYEAYKKKMQGLCDEHNLIFKFEKSKYPVTLTIKPTETDDAQLTLLPDMNEKEISPDAFLMFEFKDGAITYKTSKEFVISETLFNKIKNLFKNMHSCWMQHFFRNIIERELLDAKQENLIVLDGTTGQNALAQAREFSQAAPLSGIVLTKMDGTAKGKHLGIEKKMYSHHKFNEHATVRMVAESIEAGHTVALVSDAGTPGISDPGFLLVRTCVEAGIEVETLPGATACIPALVQSGFPCDRFCFEGFLPQKKGSPDARHGS